MKSQADDRNYDFPLDAREYRNVIGDNLRLRAHARSRKSYTKTRLPRCIGSYLRQAGNVDIDAFAISIAVNANNRVLININRHCNPRKSLHAIEICIYKIVLKYEFCSL